MFELFENTPNMIVFEPCSLFLNMIGHHCDLGTTGRPDDLQRPPWQRIPLGPAERTTSRRLCGDSELVEATWYAAPGKTGFFFPHGPAARRWSGDRLTTAVAPSHFLNQVCFVDDFFLVQFPHRLESATTAIGFLAGKD